MRLCKDGLNQATSCSNGRAADDDSDDDWGTWAAPAPVEVEDEEEKEDEEAEDWGGSMSSRIVRPIVVVTAASVVNVTAAAALIAGMSDVRSMRSTAFAWR